MDVPATPDLRPLISFDKVDKRYGDRPVFDQLSFSITRGEFVLLTGPSGAGKSTVLRLIAALERPTAGSITVAGENLARLRSRALPLFRRSLGIVLQTPMLLEDRTVHDNVALPAVAAGLSIGEARSRAAAALQRVALEDRATRARPRELSGGEQQRASLARALVNRPALLLVDEPTAHLDRQAASDLLRLLEQFVVAGVTLVLASHDSTAPRPVRSRVIELEPKATTR